MIDFEKTPEISRWLGTGSINVFGLPFAGKDSQANRLRNRFGGTVLSGGDILRNSRITQETRNLIDNGRLAPSDEYTATVLPYLQREEFAGKPLFLSSVGRWHGEEEPVFHALEASHHPLKAVIFLAISQEEAVRRLHLEETRQSRGHRVDDTIETLAHRFDEFREKTQPVIDYWRDQGYLIEVNAEQSKDEVERQILGALALRSTQD